MVGSDLQLVGGMMKRLLPSSQTTFRGRTIYSVGKPKQVQLTNAFNKLVSL